jgi:cytochrome c553
MNIVRATLIVFLLLSASHALADTPNGQAIAQQGNGHGVAPCMACHGADGGGQAAAGFPCLAGLPQAYLLKQLDDFANGTRANATMQPVASGLSDAERDAVAEYYSKLSAPALTSSPAPSGDAAQMGQMLATRGRWGQSLPGCEQCHGPDGVGVGDNFPPLTGQSSVYLSNELHAWQQGARRNDPLQLMQNVAAKLSEADIAAVSAWYAAQPVASSRGKQP